LNISDKIFLLPKWCYIACCSRSIDAINVNKNKVVFFVDDRVLVKLLRQQKMYGAKKFIAEFLSSLWTL